ncbi:MAG: T9SS type A sorting domain-containing protein [Ignavibacteria bacterium]|nr:T9SS type A sorting domain-containing protein [Ignavibacteria bacterium]
MAAFSAHRKSCVLAVAFTALCLHVPARAQSGDWTIFNTQNSALTANWILCIAEDSSGNIWMGTGGGGVCHYGASAMEVFDSTNSPLPNNDIRMIFIDRHDNKWIATKRGLAVYRAGGVLLSVPDTAASIPESFELFQNYPNPFTTGTSFTFSLPDAAIVRLEIHDALGRLLDVPIAAQEYAAGRHSVKWNAGALPSGVYVYRIKVTPLNGSVKTASRTNTGWSHAKQAVLLR